MIRDLCGVCVGVLLVLVQPSLVHGQYLSVKGSAEEQQILDRYAVPVRQHDSLSILQTTSQILSNLQKDGYFAAQASYPFKVDSLQWEVSIKVGSRFEWAYLSPGNLDALMQEKSGYRERFFLNRPFSYQDIEELMERVLKASENQGYPFASVRLKNVIIKDEKVEASLHYESGPFITFGPLQVSGTNKIKADFLASLLKIPGGSAYSERKVEQIVNTLRTLPFLTLENAVEVRFQNDEAEVHLNLSDRKSSRIDGLINLLPNENKVGQLLLTGRAEMLLNNLMHRGRQFSLQWERLQVESQQLSFSYQHSHLFKTPLQAGVSFELFKEDTLFMNRKLGLQLSYPILNGGNLSLVTELYNSNQLSEQVGIRSGNQLADFSTVNTGLSFQLSRVDDILLPKKGFRVSSTIGFGRKQLQNKNGESRKDDFWQPWVQSFLEQYYQPAKLWIIYHQLSGAFIHSDVLFLNELYRVGGLRSLRGFNDNFFFASYYAISNLELRLLLEQKENAQSYLFVFYDQGILGHRLSTDYQDTPMGIGAGLSFSTDMGVFNVAYALGKTRANSLNPSLSKIHFGYISRF